MGELRDRRRLALPAVVALGGIVVPILIYLAINAGHPSASGCKGTAMSTDHRVRARPAGPGRARRPRPGTYLPADVRDRRRRRWHYRDRTGLQQPSRRHRAGHRPRDARRGRRRALARIPERPDLLPARPRGLDRVLQVRCRPGSCRTGSGPARAGLPGHQDGPRAGVGDVPALPRAADARTSSRGQGERQDGNLAQRPAAADLSSLDQLPDRAAVRALQRRDHHQRRLPGPRLHLAGPRSASWSAMSSASQSARSAAPGC